MSGTRGSFGNFIHPLSEQFGWSVKQVSLAASISTLFYGMAQPIIGFIVNRKGARAAILLGTIFYGSLTILLSRLTDLWMLYLVYGLLMGAAWGATANTPNAALISRWFTKRKGLALSVAISGMAMGNFILIPFSMYLILNIGWRWSLVVLGSLVLAISVPFSLKFLVNSPEEKGLLPDGEEPSARTTAEASQASKVAARKMGLPQAARTRPFWLMLSGFFVCGFTSMLSSTFFVPMAIKNGFGEFTSAQAAGVMGAAAAIGLWIGGHLSDVWGRKRPLAAFYFLRAIGFILLVSTHSLPGLYISAIFMGFGSFGTAPITAGMVGDIYGVLSMGTIFGVISTSHQIGGALSIYLAGSIVDSTGSYYWAMVPGILLLFGATTVSLLIPEKKKEKASPVGAT